MATELGDAYVQIIPSARGITGKIQQAIGGESAKAGRSAGQSLGRNLISVATKVITAVGIGKALGASLMAGGALQQSLGGVETLFKGHSKRVVNNARQAYRTAGISANSYMENVTSFSASLLQSLGGDTKKAADIADMAMVDMADNMNKMGTPLQSIQDAYQGFAKQNYTMLDNLKLGYGGTKSEMERLLADAQKLTGVKYDINNLSDVYEAIHAIQENLGITGTTAKEAEETLTGSFMAMKASAQNVLGNMALGENLKPSLFALADTTATFLFGNFLPMVAEIISNVPTVISRLITAGAPHILNAGKQLMDNLGIGFSSSLNGIGAKIQANLQPIVNAFQTAFGQLPALFDAAAGAIMPIIETVIIGFSKMDFSGIASLVSSIIPAITAAFQTFMSIVSPAIDTLVNSFVNLWNSIQPVLSILAEALMPVFQVVASFLGGVVKGALLGLAGTFDLISIAVQLLTPVVGALVAVFNWLSPALAKVAEWVGVAIGLFGNFGKAGESLKTLMKNAWENIQTAISVAKTGITNAIKAVIKFFTNMGQGGSTLKGIMDTVWNSIKTSISVAKNFISGAISGIRSFFTNLGSAGQSLRSGLSSAWSSIQSAVSSAGSKITGVVDRVKGVFNSLKNIDLFGAGKAILDGFLNGLKSVWGKVKNFVGGIAGWIKDHKGPISYDRRLLIPAGRAIMGSLDKGLTKYFSDVKSTVSSMGQQIADEMTSSFGNMDGQLAYADAQFNHTLRSEVVSPQDKLGEVLNAMLPKFSPEVVVTLDGREIARASRDYTDEELENKRYQENFGTGGRF